MFWLSIFLYLSLPFELSLFPLLALISPSSEFPLFIFLLHQDKTGWTLEMDFKYFSL
jgi:hypothetical protein